MNAVDKLARAQAFIFDFDGTLAPNLNLVDMRRQVIALTAGRGVPNDEFEHLFIVEIIEAATSWLADNDPVAANAYHATAHGLITDFELAAAAKAEPFPGVREMLGELKSNGKRLGVVTRNCEPAVRTVFHDIDDFCETVLARDNAEFLKPDLRHVTQALSILGVAPQHAAMIGDGQMDMRVGKQLGMLCVGVLSGSSSLERLRDAGADLILDSVQGLACQVT
ncbi:MAG: HAD family hydrolase [Gammaproteobacteria bacterium]|nr:HAD family hydrolase [Gammaproteobacteria bacterium]